MPVPRQTYGRIPHRQPTSTDDSRSQPDTTPAPRAPLSPSARPGSGSSGHRVMRGRCHHAGDLPQSGHPCHKPWSNGLSASDNRSPYADRCRARAVRYLDLRDAFLIGNGRRSTKYDGSSSNPTTSAGSTAHPVCRPLGTGALTFEPPTQGAVRSLRVEGHPP
jgi:hypothetical protein